MTQNATLERTWQMVPLTNEERTAIQARVREIGQRLQDPSQVYKRATLAAQSSRYSIALSQSARMQSLALGPLGLALFFAEMDRVLPEEGWDKPAQNYLEQVYELVQQEETVSFGLFSGTSGLLFTAAHLSRSGTRLQDASLQIAAPIFTAINKYFIPTDIPRPDAFALSSGIVGIGTTLLTLAEQPSLSITKQARRHLERLVHHLCWLALRDKNATIEHFARWYPNEYIREAQARWLPEIAFQGTGQRRGLSGLIALLSLVLESDLEINAEDVTDALDLLCSRVSNELTQSKEDRQHLPDAEGDYYHRPGPCAPFAWCNGISGIARSLSLAGRALGDEDFTAFARRCMKQASASFKQNPQQVGPSLCHGIAGLLQVCIRFAGETDDRSFDEDIRLMLHRILELFEEDRPFGYRSFEPEYIRVDTPWLFDGASGVALTLLSLLSPIAPAWDRILLLS